MHLGASNSSRLLIQLRKRYLLRQVWLHVILCTGFDDWSEASRPFISLFIVFPSHDAANPDSHLLEFALILYECSAENYANFIKATLTWFSLSHECLVYPIGLIGSKSCSTYKAKKQTDLVCLFQDVAVIFSTCRLSGTWGSSLLPNWTWLVGSCLISNTQTVWLIVVDDFTAPSQAPWNP